MENEMTKQYEKICSFCQENFSTTRNTNDFCSYRCRKQWVKSLPKPNTGKSNNRRKKETK